MSQQKAYEYLYFGYALETTDSSFVESCLPHKPAHLEYTPEDAGRLLDTVFDNLLEQSCENGLYVIPVSGGWDSRIIAGAVRERLDAREIKMVTFGVPGQLDYDLGRLVAKTLGVEHFAIDLSKVALTWEELLSSVKDAPWTYVPDAFYNRYCLSRTGMVGANVLSGFLGDPLTGGHFSGVLDPDRVQQDFLDRQKISKTCHLCPAGYDPRSSIRVCSDTHIVPVGDMLDISIRQSNCIAPIVTPVKRWNSWGMYMGEFDVSGMHVFAPFAHPAWAAYWLCAPRSMKRKQILYLEMMKQKFPHLAGLPSKYSYGLPPSSQYRLRFFTRKHALHAELSRLFPSLVARPKVFLNYLDFAQAFRKRPDFKALMDTAFDYLKNNNTVPWLDIDAIRAEHMSGDCNHEGALLVLTGLALNLAAEAV